MQLRKFKTAIIVTGILTAVIIGSAVIFFSEYGLYTEPPQGVVTLTSHNFYYSSGEFNFSLMNYGSETAITNVTVGNSPCTGDFAPLKSNIDTPLSCTTSAGANFTDGEILNYIIHVSNGELVGGRVSAQ